MTREKLNFAQSFEKMHMTPDQLAVPGMIIDLYHGLLDSYKILKTERQDAAAEAFGMLTMKVKKFLVESTDLTIEQIDERLSIISPK